MREVSNNISGRELNVNYFKFKFIVLMMIFFLQNTYFINFKDLMVFGKFHINSLV